MDNYCIGMAFCGAILKMISQFKLKNYEKVNNFYKRNTYFPVAFNQVPPKR
jgi:hypothetical protein